ncbi:MAG: GNAT family N-acetyltransferase [Desulfobulbaceae bacterium]|jgi:acyl-CoA hydrolase/GNAT superfamily N-acetyltransferase|nr:GNAT family N-acetyltransferase [Desulfobulbaceae bacterium]
MAGSLYWADTYLTKLCTSDKAIRHIKNGQRVFLGSACGVPQELARALAAYAQHLSGVEVVRMLSSDTAPLTEIANRSNDSSLNIRNIYLGSTSADYLARNRRFITPMNLSMAPSLFTSRRMPIHVALIQVSPPDDFGWMSLGVSVDVTQAATLAANMVIAQINPRMPRVMGQSFIHVNQVDYIVECEEDLLTIPSISPSDISMQIGQHISRLIEDGSTIQVGLDAASQATVQALQNKNDLGLHSQYLTEDVMHLYASGVVNNRHKGFNDGKLVASAALGSKNLYEFLHDNPAIEFHPSDYVNNAFIIARHNKMVSVNRAKAVDLTGQVQAEALVATHFAGVSGILDFVRGARGSKGGKSILFLPSLDCETGKSAIIPRISDAPVTVPRGDVHFIATEYGLTNLIGKSLQERAIAMISIAHPDYRDELLEAAKERGLVGKDRKLGASNKAVYPVHLEDSVERDGISIAIRPAKPADERRIQEHYYTLEKDDVLTRFFHEKTSFSHQDVDTVAKIDYLRDLSLIALVGEPGFEKVVAIGEYLLDADNNLAEVAFSTSKDFQGKGLGKLLMAKLSEAARDNGIAGFVAFTAPTNKPMISLFKTLPYKTKTVFEEDMLKLSCRFDEVAA